MFKEPDEEVLQPAQLSWFENYINEVEGKLYSDDWLVNREYANYKIYMTVELTGATNTWKDSYIIYTNAKFDPSVIDEAS